MKNFLFFSLIMFASLLHADGQVLTAKSPEHRVSLLELYTSEGCSSCPPADKFLSGLHNAGVTNNQLIPLAFHVTSGIISAGKILMLLLFMTIGNVTTRNIMK